MPKEEKMKLKPRGDSATPCVPEAMNYRKFWLKEKKVPSEKSKRIEKKNQRGRK